MLLLAQGAQLWRGPPTELPLLGWDTATKGELAKVGGECRLAVTSEGGARWKTHSIMMHPKKVRTNVQTAVFPIVGEPDRSRRRRLLQAADRPPSRGCRDQWILRGHFQRTTRQGVGIDVRLSTESSPLYG